MLVSYPWLSLIPPAIAVLMALWTRQVILSLLVGVVSAVALLQGGNPVTIALDTQRRLVTQIADPSNAAVLLLLLLIGGFVALLQASGAAEAFIRRFCGELRSARAVRTLTAVSGILVFFSDSASPLLRGPIFAPLFIKLRQSREKLALLLDATAAPISSIVPISPWTAVLVALVAKQLAELQIEQSPVELVLTAIAYQFYTIAILLLAVATGWFDLSFGEMRQADTEARHANFREARPPAVNVATSVHDATVREPSPWVLVVALGLLVGVLAIVLIYTAQSGTNGVNNANIFGNSIPGITLGFTAASVYLAAVLVRCSATSAARLQKIWLRGAMRMLGIMAILSLAWSLGTCMREMGTGAYLAGLCKDTLPAALTPAAIFLISSIASFVSGTAWGCYALFIPIALPIAVEMNLDLPMVLGAVVSGSLFGDHCSPFSDTTILSSAGADCDHLRHVRTQLPYACLAMIAATAAFVAVAVGSLIWGYVILGIVLTVSAGMLHWRTSMPQPVALQDEVETFQLR